MNKSGRKLIIGGLLTILAAVFGMSGCVDLSMEPSVAADPIRESMVTQSTEAICTEAPPKQDGSLQTLANGDSYYTPAISHVTMDDGRSVLYYNDLLLVFTYEDLDLAEMNALALSVDGEVMGVINGGIHAFQIKVAEKQLSELETLSDELMDNELVLYACAEYPVQIMEMQDDNPWDPDGPEEDRGNEADPDGLDWWAEAIGAYSAWAYADLCGEVRIGIVDNGFYDVHEDLPGQITFVTNQENNTASDHGTMVAGIIAAQNNDLGIRGVADKAKLYCADLWPTDDPDSYHTMGEYLAVVNYMGQCGVRVVNNSWGCHLPSEERYLEACYGSASEGHEGEYQKWLDQRLEHDLIPTAEFCIVMIAQLMTSDYRDMIHVQAAGNGLNNIGPGVDARYNGFFSRVTEDVYNRMAPKLLEALSAAGITYEDIDQRIFVVGAIENTRDSHGNYLMTSFSNYGDTVDICAPGHIVFTTVPPVDDFYYTAGFGTSFAAPMVTGSIGYLISLDPDITVAELREILLDSAKVRAVGTGASEGWSYPLVNVGAAVKMLLRE